ncbi:hypothetical protein NECAME_11821 [Necator americanus]|uniref:Uncharacterized protein n=1 Tax=Necator americanus TaxID=51031 RepID=W2T3V1_NECAM|nr:hypothetical protein NECAME_11821 [Necator americanus]ETN76229.1 hypothetical protein NECAME_11821 [Necator americanus]
MYGCSVKGLSYQIKEAWEVDQGQVEAVLGEEKEDQVLNYQMKEAWEVDQGQVCCALEQINVDARPKKEKDFKVEAALGEDKEDQGLSYQIRENGVDQEEDQEVQRRRLQTASVVPPSHLIAGFWLDRRVG